MAAVAPINTCIVFILGMTTFATSDRDASTDTKSLQLKSDGSMKVAAYHIESLKQASELELEQEEERTVCWSWCVTCKKIVDVKKASGVTMKENYKVLVTRNQNKYLKAVYAGTIILTGGVAGIAVAAGLSTAMISLRSKPCSDIQFKYQGSDVATANFPFLAKYGKAEDLDKALRCATIADNFAKGSHALQDPNVSQCLSHEWVCGEEGAEEVNMLRFNVIPYKSCFGMIK